MAFEPRIVASDDIELLTALNMEVHQLHARLYPFIFKPADRSAIRSEFERTVRRTDFAHWVAYDGDEPCGYLVLEIQRQHEDAFRHAWMCAYVHQMGVRESWRRRGVGAALIRVAEAEARHRGCAVLALDYYEGNEYAADFYRSVGFEKLQTRVIRRLDTEQ